MNILNIGNETVDVTIQNLEAVNDVIKRIRYITAGVFMKDPTGNEANVIINIIKINLVKGIIYKIDDQNSYNRQLLLTNDIAVQLTNIVSEHFALNTKEFRQSIRSLLEISLMVAFGIEHPLNLLMNGEYIDKRLSLNVIKNRNLYIKHNNLNRHFDI